MNKQLDILVYGSLNMDFVAFLNNLPKKGETLSAKEFSMIAGGKAANQAVAASRLGSSVGMVGRVGADYLGEQLLMALKQEGIITDQVKSTPNCNTGIAMVSVDEFGNNMIVTDKGANAFLSKEDIKDSEELLRASKAVILQLEMEQDVAEYIIRKARKNKKYIVLNLAPIVPIDPEVLAMVDLLVVNETEATQLSGIYVNEFSSAKVAAQEIHTKEIENVIITLGENGALLSFPSAIEHYLPPKVTVVDSTAAGDCFVASVTSFWIRYGDLGKAVKKAVEVSALSVTKKGAQSSLPTLQEYENFIVKETTQ
ncbi:ribokinase [Pseudalkalibacillus sp. A8]|uniref:ribokinase n=1 Tax=Pseudalkalibacillus sp. A8 TaxID=3382641 RepID=UPI0038B4356F